MQMSRRELISWIRSLGIEISAIEELGKGAIICEILSVLHRGFPSSFIRRPVNEHEYLRNMKICQDFFNSMNLKLYFPVDKLVKCRMQDNLEIAQWLSKYYHKNCGGGVAKVHDGKEEMVDHRKPSLRDVWSGKSSTPVRAMGSVRSENAEEMESKDKVNDLAKTTAKMRSRIEQMMQNEEKLLEQISQLKSELGGFCNRDFKSLLMTFEKERDFYFKKLFMLERYLLENESLDENARKDMFEILYEESGE